MATAERIQLPITGMTCAACVARVEKVLNRLPGVSAQVSLATETARIEVADPGTTVDMLRTAIEAAGYGIGDVRRDAAAEDRRELHLFWLSATLSAPFVVQMALMLLGGHHDVLPGGWQWLLATPVQFWIGWRFYRGAWFALRGGAANMDVLVALGTSAAYFFSAAIVLGWLPGQHVYFEASVSIITLVLLGKILELRARRRTSDALKALARLLPDTAHVLRNGILTDVAANQVTPDTLIVIKPDERAPVDGVVVEGHSDMDESLITGEAQLAAKSAGGRIFAGARNTQGQLVCRATRTGAHTHLAEVARLVEDAQASKAPVQQWADRVSAVFVPVILAISALTGVGWWLASAGLETALLNAVAVLVIACPCALGLATPTAVVAAMGRGAQFGILMRSAAVLESTARLQRLAVDKTGTLTEGEPRVVEVMPQGGTAAAELLRIAASLEQSSGHPIARAIKAHSLAQGIAPALPSDVTSDAGRGIGATLEGARYWLGAPQHLAALGLTADQNRLDDPRLANCTLVAIATPRQVLGYIALSDPIRSTSRTAVDTLRGMGIEVFMLSGDRATVAREIARVAGIESFRADLLPADKVAEIIRLQAGGSLVVGMAGDGVNDAPALASADVGFAMSAGADLAVQTAGITLMRNDLMGIVGAVQLARTCVRIIRQNLFFALIYNVIGIPLAAFGLLNPIIAGAAMAMSSVTVVTNSLRLRRWKPR